MPSDGQASAPESELLAPSTPKRTSKAGKPPCGGWTIAI